MRITRFINFLKKQKKLFLILGGCLALAGCGYEKQTEITSRNETIREGEYIKNKLLISTPAEDKAFILSIYDGVDSIDRAIRGTDANTQTHSLIGDKPTAVSTPAATATQPATSTPATPAVSTGGKTK